MIDHRESVQARTDKRAAMQEAWYKAGRPKSFRMWSEEQERLKTHLMRVRKLRIIMMSNLLIAAVCFFLAIWYWLT